MTNFKTVSIDDLSTTLGGICEPGKKCNTGIPGIDPLTGLPYRQGTDGPFIHPPPMKPPVSCGQR